MGALIVRVRNARREPLQDTVDVRVVSARNDVTIGEKRAVRGSTTIKFDGLVDFQPVIVKVFPTRYRPVAQFAVPKPGKPVEVLLHTPIDPERVTGATFPSYADVPADLQRVLESSSVEGCAGSGDGIYSVLTPVQRAGLFNLYCKMRDFGFEDDRTVWSFVDRIYRIRGDRIFVDVQVPLRDRIKDALLGDRVHEAASKLHEPPPGFAQAGSFKTAERYGNLQLTFFSSLSQPLAFKVDADIDDAAGIGHTFQVLRNWITSGSTHPYDIHEILVFRQEADLPYELA